MDETLKEIIGDVQEASRSLDAASQRAKTAGLMDVHQKLEVAWADCDVLYKSLTELEAARRE